MCDLLSVLKNERQQCQYKHVNCKNKLHIFPNQAE